MRFPRQEYWNGLLVPSARDLPNPGVKPESPALQAVYLNTIQPLYVCHVKTITWESLQGLLLDFFKRLNNVCYLNCFVKEKNVYVCKKKSIRKYTNIVAEVILDDSVFSDFYFLLCTLNIFKFESIIMYYFFNKIKHHYFLI